ncbi:nose resistant to fluoxetine protein 6 [Caerostris extrusa]|uniref:Nose resistant to fluoxetine protein 6 n=1 Tax=Caerostris extrusa TaxID=172846 RepID=A0AAV4NLU2_CAEEX|nr:nose resistant to fluoxetine protein 6 [Caerostris extrusa]
MESALKSATNSAIKMALPYVLNASAEMNISDHCIRDIMTLVSGLRNIKPWAVKFVDSSAKIIDGLLVGTLSSLGVYDECVDIEVIDERGTEKGKLLFRGTVLCHRPQTTSLPPKAKSKFYGTDEIIIPELKNFSERGTQLDVYEANIIDSYIIRPDRLDDTCLVSFAAYYEVCKFGSKDMALLQGKQFVKCCTKPKVIQYRKRKKSQDEDEYYRPS